MGDRSQVADRVKLRAHRGELLGQMLLLASSQTKDVQEEFIEEVSSAATAFYDVFEAFDLVQKFGYSPQSYWKGLKGKTFGFVDGGVANIDLPTAAPIGLRVGSYIVSPGDQSEKREEFNIEINLVDELFGTDPVIYEAMDEDIEKLRDAARIVSELAAASAIAKRVPSLSGLLLHGPLVNPVSPYGLDDFPSFTNAAAARLLGDKKVRSENERAFVPLYLELLRQLEATKIPVAGVVERSASKKPALFEACLNELLAGKKIKTTDHKKLREAAQTFLLSDADIFSLMLSPGEYVEPHPINRQGPDIKWPNAWKSEIRTYPDALTTFLKPNEEMPPFRIEMYDSDDNKTDLIGIVYYTARLLPNYGFPAGLDIVDKFAKVPAWMTRSVRGQHATVLLKKALESKDPKMIAYAKRTLAARGRDWFFRPMV